MSRTTICRSNGPIITASIALGPLVTVRKYASWHGQSVAVEARFRNGAIEFDEASLAEFVRQSQQALATPPHDPDCSGSVANVGAE